MARAGAKAAGTQRNGGRAGTAPTPAQRAYLARGLDQPGGKLPLFDTEGREVAPETIRVCLRRGWAVPWFANPIKPDWIVARLTATGYRLFDREPPAGTAEAE